MDAVTKEMIEETLRVFNFAKIHAAMEALEWQWTDTKGVPSLPELKEKARELLTHVREGWEREVKGDSADDRAMHVYFASEGGFYAEAGEGVFKLQFVLAEQETEWDEESLTIN